MRLGEGERVQQGRGKRGREGREGGGGREGQGAGQERGRRVEKYLITCNKSHVAICSIFNTAGTSPERIVYIYACTIILAHKPVS